MNVNLIRVGACPPKPMRLTYTLGAEIVPVRQFYMAVRVAGKDL